jgi:hypothetical protein
LTKQFETSASYQTAERWFRMGVQTMNMPSDDKATITNKIDKSKRPSSAPTKDELSEQVLEKVSGGGGAFPRFDFKSA